MVRSCDVCGSSYVAKRATSKYCKPACRMKASRAGVSAPVSVAAHPVDVEVAGLILAVRRELDEAGRLDSALGQAALELARNIGSPTSTGAGVASLVKQLRETMVDALKGAEKSADVLDEIRARRDAKRAAG